jgi:hypothetical protein
VHGRQLQRCDTAAFRTGSVSSTVEVGNLYAGVQGTMMLASFTGTVGVSYSVDINWGDGDTGTGTATNVAGVVTITASHTFAVDSIDETDGVYQVVVTVTGDGTTLNTTVPVEVTRPPSFLVVANVPAKAGTVLTDQVVALFIEPNAADGDAEFDASINWGDGTSGTGTVELIGTNSGLFEVAGSHTFAKSPTTALTTDLSQAWGGMFSVAEAAAKILDFSKASNSSIIQQQQPKIQPPGFGPAQQLANVRPIFSLYHSLVQVSQISEHGYR